MQQSVAMQKAVLGGGCFWCLDALFRQLVGVNSVESGYAGGIDAHPNYESVCSGRTGHAEVIQITFDPEQISFDDLLAVFFSSHDPTTHNRQGHDVGTQYRSVIVAQDSAQYAAALSCIATVNSKGLFDKPIVTEVLEKMPFHKAEDYHQDYFTRHPEQGYCAVVIGPKLARFREKFASRLKPT